MISPVSFAGSTPASIGEVLSRAPATSGTAGAGSPFGALFEGLLNSASESRNTSEAAIRDLATGRTDDLHNVMLQVAQADLTFRLVLEIRNRLTDAYQEVMKMQI